MAKQNKQAQASIDLSQYKTKSEAIRALAASGMSRGDIAKTMNIRYQHVRNVLVTPLKKQA